MPGYSSTVLWVESELRDGDKKVAELYSKRMVDEGGGYTAGAHESISTDVAEDIASYLKATLGRQP